MLEELVGRKVKVYLSGQGVMTGLTFMGLAEPIKGEVMEARDSWIRIQTRKEVEYIKVDDQKIDHNTIKIFVNEQEVSVADISEEKPFKLTKGDTFTFKITGKISAGSHTLGFSLKTIEAGTIAFDVEDKL